MHISAVALHLNWGQFRTFIHECQNLLVQFNLQGLCILTFLTYFLFLYVSMYIVVLHISAICATFLKIYSIICSSSPLSFVASTKAIRNILCYFTSIRVILIVLSTNSLSHTQTCTRFPILVGVKWNVQFIYDYVLYDGHIMDVKKESSMNRKCMNWFCFCSVLHEEKHNHLKSDFFKICLHHCS